MAVMAGSYLRMLRDYRGKDFQAFISQHDRLFRLAKQRGDHGGVTRNYYSVMGPLIEAYYGPSYHFVPPERRGQSFEASIERLYRWVIDVLGLQSEVHVVDLGCGVGGAVRGVARMSGCRATGITLGPNEVEEGNALIAAASLSDRCRIVEGNMQELPFDDGSLDAAMAIYALKYLPRLDRVMAEVARVLKPGGRFCAYSIVKTDAYDPENPEHTEIVSRFEYATGMPALHTQNDQIRAAEEAGLICIERGEMQGAAPWYHYFVVNPLIPWAVRSRGLNGAVGLGERLRLFPHGFQRFTDVFVNGTVRDIIRAGRMGILTGAGAVAFEKP